jgi:hypothetical protein
VVGFKSFFEDRHNVYILLELCANKVRCYGDLGCMPVWSYSMSERLY